MKRVALHGELADQARQRDKSGTAAWISRGDEVVEGRLDLWLGQQYDQGIRALLVTGRDDRGPVRPILLLVDHNELVTALRIDGIVERLRIRSRYHIQSVRQLGLLREQRRQYHLIGTRGTNEQYRYLFVH
jgi:hypothetical protein